MRLYFVTGVSGDLGSRLITELSNSPDTGTIIGLDRRPLRISAAKLKYVQHEAGKDDIGDLIQGADTLIHLAPTSPSVLKSLLENAANAQVRSIVMLSSAAVFGAWPTNSVPLTEDSPVRPNPGFKYAVEMAENERLLQEFKHEHPEISVAVMRMAMVLGGGFARALLVPLGLYDHRHHESSRPVQYLHLDDAVSALSLAATRGLDGTFNVAPNGFISDEKARAVAGAPPRPGLPKRVAYIANDMVWRSRKRRDFATASLYLEHPWVLSNDRLRAVGWAPNYSTEEVLVAEARPTWWGSLRAGQRRAIVSGSIMTGSTASTLGVIVVLIEFLRRKYRSK